AAAPAAGNSDAQKQTQRALLKYNASSSSGGGGGGGGRNNRNGSRSHSGDAPDGTRLSVKSNRQEVTPRQSGVSQTAKDISAFDFGSISKEEAKQWGESFDALMQSANGRKVFREYLKSEYSEENILFWLACEDLKLESTPKAWRRRRGPKEVSLDARVREIINKNMVEPNSAYIRRRAGANLHPNAPGLLPQVSELALLSAAGLRRSRHILMLRHADLHIMPAVCTLFLNYLNSYRFFTESRVIFNHNCCFAT
uniref:RGS domain-containing protein n=1 Tax=Macrostomum lignano TaxID=282301 RepID=A0A1I8FNC2_9PLAT